MSLLQSEHCNIRGVCTIILIYTTNVGHVCTTINTKQCACNNNSEYYIIGAKEGHQKLPKTGTKSQVVIVLLVDCARKSPLAKLFFIYVYVCRYIYIYICRTYVMLYDVRRAVELRLKFRRRTIGVLYSVQMEMIVSLSYLGTNEEKCLLIWSRQINPLPVRNYLHA